MFCENCGTRIPASSDMYTGYGGVDTGSYGGQAGSYGGQAGFYGGQAGSYGGQAGKGRGLAAAVVLAVVLVVALAAGAVFAARKFLPGREGGIPSVREEADSALPTERPETEAVGRATEAAAPDSGTMTGGPVTEESAASGSIEGIADLTEEELLETAMLNSTTDIAGVTDADWFYLYREGSPEERERMMGELVRIEDMPLLLCGGWRAYMCEAGNISESDTERYLNVWIDTDGSIFKVTVNWGFLYDKQSGVSTEETGSDVFKGTWDGQTGTARVTSDFGVMELESFYMKPYYENYGIGRLEWISGETDYIVLIR